MNELERAQAAWPIVESINLDLLETQPFRKFDPLAPSKLLDGWYLTTKNENGDEIEIHIYATGRKA